MNIHGFLVAVATLISIIAVPASFGATAGQIDTFEDGTTGGWLVGLLGAQHPAPPQNVPGGGPAGVDDNYLFLNSVGGGSGPGSRLSVLNFSQWAGDYLAAAIGAIRMDVYNLGPSDLSLRLLFEDPQGGPPQDVAFSKVPILLPANSGWTSVEFPINPAALQADVGSVQEALMNATAMRIFHSTSGTGETIVSSLGVDNIQAVPQNQPVPETSSTLSMMALSLLAFASLWRARNRSFDAAVHGPPLFAGRPDPAAGGRHFTVP